MRARYLDSGMRRGLAALAVSGCAVLICAFAGAQMNVGEVSGAVRDISGVAVIHASVKAVTAENSATFSVLSYDFGNFHLTALPPGNYTLTISAEGFQDALRHLTLHAGDRASESFSMAVGMRTQVIVVEGGPGQLQAESAEVKDVIEHQQVIDLPVRDREFLELAMLGPGVAN